jgi:hypothetical protein
LISRSQTLLDGLDEVLADAAYGGMSVRREVEDGLGVTLLAPPVKTTNNPGGKADFDIDFDRMVATCPGGVATTDCRPAKKDGEPSQAFKWPKGSQSKCACSDRCMVHKPRKKKDDSPAPPSLRLVLHPQEQALRAVRADWERSEVRQRYRQRSQGERLIHSMTRRGARQANAWGLHSARLQAYCVAAVNNLKLLARKLAEMPAGQRAA